MTKGVFHEMSKGEFGNIPGAKKFLAVKPKGWGSNGIIYIGIGSEPVDPFGDFFSGSDFGVGFTEPLDFLNFGGDPSSSGPGTVGIQDPGGEGGLAFAPGTPALYNDGGTSASGASGAGGLNFGNGGGVGSTQFNTGYP